jgi:hypothetical protein
MGKYVGLHLNISTEEFQGLVPPASWRAENPDTEVVEVEIVIDGQTRQLTFAEFTELVFPAGQDKVQPDREGAS